MRTRQSNNFSRRSIRCLNKGALSAIICLLLAGTAAAKDYTGETITYSISTGGTAIYSDLGLVDLAGTQVRSITFKTHIGGLLDDSERIYAKPDSPLPLRIEREVDYMFRKEHIVEAYSPQTKSVIVTKYNRERFVKEYCFSSPTPIQNAILLPFYLRTVPDLQVGWSFDVNILKPYKVTLKAIGEVTVPAGTFTAYQFVSEPRKFEIWITTDADRVPVKIQGTGGYKYTLDMKARVFSDAAQNQ